MPESMPNARSTSTWWDQLLGRSTFRGEIAPARVPLLAPFSGRPTLPFPHPLNYKHPLRILETYYWGSERDHGASRHTRFLGVPGFAPVLVTRDPRLIRAIAAATGDGEGKFDRDTLPTDGIARATGEDTLLYANGAEWRRQKRIAVPPFSRTTLFHPEYFHEFARTFTLTASRRVGVMESVARGTKPPRRVLLEPEIKTVMLEMLVNNFFGAEVPYEELRTRFVPALERVIDFIVCDTVVKRVGVPLRRLRGISRFASEAHRAQQDFEELTTRVIAPRRDSRGLWAQFKSDAPDEALRANIRVFIAGALEATTSYASWAISHLARHPEAQSRLYGEVEGVHDFTPEILAGARYLNQVLDETLRLTPSLYFFPRRPRSDTWVETTDGQRLFIPKGTHILLDVWNANRHEDHWGVAVTGHPADRFVPERWDSVNPEDRRTRDLLHFGFGHGPRYCPGKHLGQIEVALVVGAFVKMFKFSAPRAENPARAGVSTKPADGVQVDLELRR